METETIDKLFLELSQVTNAKTARESNLESAILYALGLSDVWLPSGEAKPEHRGEFEALKYMFMALKKAIREIP